jgi:hypothetical protein
MTGYIRQATEVYISIVILLLTTASNSANEKFCGICKAAPSGNFLRLSPPDCVVLESLAVTGVLKGDTNHAITLKIWQNHASRLDIWIFHVSR